MSIESLCAGDTVVVENETTASDASWGATVTPSDGATLNCRIGLMSAREARKYQARGHSRLYKARFSFDPSLATNKRLRWIKTNNYQTTISRFLRVLAPAERFSPSGGLKIWITDCEEVSSRRES